MSPSRINVRAVTKTRRSDHETPELDSKVTNSTNAIEEDAYFNDLVLDLDIPVAFVGAMRAADTVSADGPANLLTAARMITREEFHLNDEPNGVYVVLNETVHAARDVTKTHTTKVDTFDSGAAGPIAVFTDEQLVLYREPGSYSSNLADADLDATSDMVVPIVTTGAGADAYPIEQAIAGEYDVDGILVQATGWWVGPRRRSPRRARTRSQRGSRLRGPPASTTVRCG